jgi:hypothetical protein
VKTFANETLSRSALENRSSTFCFVSEFMFVIETELKAHAGSVPFEEHRESHQQHFFTINFMTDLSRDFFDSISEGRTGLCIYFYAVKGTNVVALFRKLRTLFCTIEIADLCDIQLTS